MYKKVKFYLKNFRLEFLLLSITMIFLFIQNIGEKYAVWILPTEVLFFLLINNLRNLAKASKCAITDFKKNIKPLLLIILLVSLLLIWGADIYISLLIGLSLLVLLYAWAEEILNLMILLLLVVTVILFFSHYQEAAETAAVHAYYFLLALLAFKIIYNKNDNDYENF